MWWYSIRVIEPAEIADRDGGFDGLNQPKVGYAWAPTM